MSTAPYCSILSYGDSANLCFHCLLPSLCFSAFLPTLLSSNSSYMFLIQTREERGTDRISQLSSTWSSPVSAHGPISDHFIGHWTTIASFLWVRYQFLIPLTVAREISHCVKEYDSFCLSRHSKYHAQYTELIVGGVIRVWDIE